MWCPDYIICQRNLRKRLKKLYLLYFQKRKFNGQRKWIKSLYQTGHFCWTIWCNIQYMPYMFVNTLNIFREIFNLDWTNQVRLRSNSKLFPTNLIRAISNTTTYSQLNQLKVLYYKKIYIYIYNLPINPSRELLDQFLLGINFTSFIKNMSINFFFL
jgi:hypothetical protein